MLCVVYPARWLTPIQDTIWEPSAAAKQRKLRRWSMSLMAQGGHVGVQDDTIHRRSGQISVTGGVDVRQEGVQLLVGVEDIVVSKVVG